MFKCLVDNNSTFPAYPCVESPNERKTIVPGTYCCLCVFVDDNLEEIICAQKYRKVKA